MQKNPHAQALGRLGAATNLKKGSAYFAMLGKKGGLAAKKARNKAKKLPTDDSRENNPQPLKAWEGKTVEFGSTFYHTAHTWVRRNFGIPKECEFCGVKEGNFNWAMKNNVLSRDRKNWLRLCMDCHRVYDKNTGKKTL